MGFGKGKTATLWAVEKDGDKFYRGRISTSYFNSKENKYVQDFSGFVRFINEAAKKIEPVYDKKYLEGPNHKKLKFKIGDCEVTNYYDSENKVEKNYYAIFDFEPVVTKKK